MEKELDFTIPKQQESAGKKTLFLLVVLNIIILVTVLFTSALVLWQSNKKNVAVCRSSLSPSVQKELALKLEKQGLSDASASAWEQYLEIIRPDDKESALIWYRIGKLFQEDHHYEKALESFYRSEMYAKPEEISAELSRRVQECLEAMGKFAALRYELEDRVGLKSPAKGSGPGGNGDEVVAEIGTMKITKADLDHRIENQIDRQLSQFSAFLSDERRKEQKEAIFKEFSTASQRQIFLNQMILEEILYRKAREENLADDPAVQSEITALEHSLLAKKVLEKELAEKIHITPGDLESYYAAHKEQFITPERAKIAHILVATEDAAQRVRKELAGGAPFEKIAAEMSTDTATAGKGGNIDGWIDRNSSHIPGFGEAADALPVIFSADAGQIAAKEIKTDQGIHIIKVIEREREQQKPFDACKDEVFRALKSVKEREVQQGLFAELKDKYNVVLHQSAFLSDAAEKKAESAVPPKNQTIKKQTGSR